MIDAPMILTAFVVAPLLGALLMPLVPAAKAKAFALAIALLCLVCGAVVLGSFIAQPGADERFLSEHVIHAGWGIAWRLAADPIAASLIALAGLIAPIAVLSSWKVTERPKTYVALLLLLFGGMNGVFAARDGVLFYVFWELLLIPMFALIAIWGGEQRRSAAMKFALYSFAGSVLMLLALFLCWVSVPKEGVLVAVPNYVALPRVESLPAGIAPEKIHGGGDRGAELNRLRAAGIACDFYEHCGVGMADGTTHDLTIWGQQAIFFHDPVGGVPPVWPTWIGALGGRMVEMPGPISLEYGAEKALCNRVALIIRPTFDLRVLPLLWHHWSITTIAGITVATLGFWLMVLAFLVKIPAIPFHTWLPHAHVQAPTAISVILAGVLLKLGTYGLLRMAYPIFPTAAIDAAIPLGVLGVIGILWGAAVALAQNDLKRLVAYSSVSHMGYCLLGLAALSAAGISGSIVQGVTHGIGSALLFLLVGVIYDRAHHRRVDGFGGLWTPMPRFSAVAILAFLAAAGLPGLSGFPGELLATLGAFQSNAGGAHHPDAFRWLGIAATLGVILSAAYLLWALKRLCFGPVNPACATMPDLDRREGLMLAPLVVLLVLLGVAPWLLTAVTDPAAQALADHLAYAAGHR